MTPFPSSAVPTPRLVERGGRLGSSTQDDAAALVGDASDGRDAGVGGVRADVAGVLVRWLQARPVVVLTGDVDLVAAPQVASVGLFLRRWSYPSVVDAAGVRFIDVAGLRAVLGLSGVSASVEVRYPSVAVVRLLWVLGQAGAGIRVGRAAGPFPALMLREVPSPR